MHSFDVICFSHLRWDFVYQRPQHLLSRCSLERRVFYVEEPRFVDGDAYIDISQRQNGVIVVVPHLPLQVTEVQAHLLQAQMLDELITQYAINAYICWYYTPMALAFAVHLEPLVVVYDCMDELSAFQGASLEMLERETEMLVYANLVFTGGYSLYEAKRYRNRHVYPFPSSVDAAHFRQARSIVEEPSDVAILPHPRLGFYGVIDERLDLELIAALADARPEWQVVLVGPIAKIDEKCLPRRQNIHYLGARSYTDLPAQLAAWDVALMPFAMNEATRFISPTKTPEYLAGGKPVVSTPIRDVIQPYGEQGFVAIAGTVEDFITAIEQALQEDVRCRLQRVDAFLAHMSWDITWKKMSQMIESVVVNQENWQPYAMAVSPLLGDSDLTSVGGME